MEAVLKSKTDLTAKQKKDVVDTFRNFDRNGNGSIPSSDLKVIRRKIICKQFELSVFSGNFSSTSL